MMETAPIASERFQDALPLIPGVVRGPDGLLNISGTRSNQSALMFNDADGTDPVTGEDAIELPIDAVSVVQVRGAAFAPEFGLSAGAVTTVETQTGGRRLAYHGQRSRAAAAPARRRVPRHRVVDAAVHVRRPSGQGQTQLPRVGPVRIQPDARVRASRLRERYEGCRASSRTAAWTGRSARPVTSPDRPWCRRARRRTPA